MAEQREVVIGEGQWRAAAMLIAAVNAFEKAGAELNRAKAVFGIKPRDGFYVDLENGKIRVEEAGEK